MFLDVQHIKLQPIDVRLLFKSNSLVLKFCVKRKKTEIAVAMSANYYLLHIGCVFQAKKNTFDIFVYFNKDTIKIFRNSLPTS